MTVTYFYYISEPKVEMLHAQLGKPRRLPEGEYNLRIPGVAVGMKLSGRDTNLVRKTIEVLHGLQKAGQVAPIKDIAVQTPNVFFLDNGTWHSGIFAFWFWTSRIFTYLLWKQAGSDLILLVGSPANILGEKTIAQEVHFPGSNTMVGLIRNFLTSSFGAVDENFVADPEFEIPFSLRPLECQRETGTVPAFFSEYSEAQPKAILKLWTNHLAQLPSTQLETLFKLQQGIDLSQKNETRNDREAPTVDFARAKRIALGSPIYTAIT